LDKKYGGERKKHNKGHALGGISLGEKKRGGIKAREFLASGATREARGGSVAEIRNQRGGGLVHGGGTGLP